MQQHLAAIWPSTGGASRSWRPARTGWRQPELAPAGAGASRSWRQPELQAVTADAPGSVYATCTITNAAERHADVHGTKWFGGSTQGVGGSLRCSRHARLRLDPAVGALHVRRQLGEALTSLRCSRHALLDRTHGGVEMQLRIKLSEMLLRHDGDRAADSRR